MPVPGLRSCVGHALHSGFIAHDFIDSPIRSAVCLYAADARLLALALTLRTFCVQAL